MDDVLSKLQPLIERVTALEARVEQAEANEATWRNTAEELEKLLGSAEADERLQRAVDDSIAYLSSPDSFINNQTRELSRGPSTNRHITLLECLLQGANPRKLRNKDAFVEILLRLRASALDDEILLQKYEEVVNLSPTAPLITFRMQIALQELEAVEKAARLKVVHKWVMVTCGLVDGITDWFVIYIFIRQSRFFFLACTIFGIIGNLTFSGKTLEELNVLVNPEDPAAILKDHIANVLTMGAWSTYRVANELVNKQDSQRCLAMTKILRGSIFEAGWSLLPTIYSILISGVVQGYELSNHYLYAQFLSACISVVMMAHCAHFVDRVTSLALCQNTKTCRRWYTKPGTRLVMFTYRFCEMCTLINALLFSATTRPFGPFCWVFFRGLCIFIAWCRAQLTRQADQEVHIFFPGVAFYNPFSFDNALQTEFGKWLRLFRLLETVILLCVLLLMWKGLLGGVAPDGVNWAADFGWSSSMNSPCSGNEKSHINMSFGNIDFHITDNQFCNNEESHVPKFCLSLLGTVGSVLFLVLSVFLHLWGIFTVDAAPRPHCDSRGYAMALNEADEAMRRNSSEVSLVPVRTNSQIFDII